MTAPRAFAVPRVGACLIGVVAACWLGVTLWRPFTVGMSQSYDTALYARSLWGVANGAPHNPVYGTHWLGIHANFFMALTAPLTKVLAAWQVLVVSQAIAFGATVALVISSVFGASGKADDDTPSLVLVGGWSLVAVLGAPLVLNPFLFDARPGLVAVPLLLAALLRAQKRGGWDGVCLALCIGAALVREEFAALAGAALVLSPPRTVPVRWGLRNRVLGAALLGAYFAAYWGLVRPSLADGFAAERAAQAANDLFALSGDGVGAFRRDFVLSTLAIGGGLAILGWRWLGTAVAGLVFVAASTKMAEHALNFHYGMFAAPGMIVAAVAGVEKVRSQPKRRRSILLVGALCIGLVSTALFGAHPLGGRFQAAHFGADADAVTWLAECHALVDTVPPEEGVAVASMFGAPLADRAVVWSMETLTHHLREHGTLPEDLRWVVLDNHRFGSLGRLLVHVHGLRLYGIATGRIALLGPAGAPENPPPGLGTAVALRECRFPLVKWDDLGLVLCDVERLADDRIGFVVARVTGRPPDALPLALQASIGRDGTMFSAAMGLIDISTLDVGQGVFATSAERIRAPELRIHMVDVTGREYPGRRIGAEDASLGVALSLPPVE